MDRRALRIDAGAAGGRVLVALSGGADSVALLLLLLDAGAGVCAAHFEHGIRGGDSVADMAFCRELCVSHGVPFFCERADVPAARLPGEGLEAAARRLRYAFLRRAKEEAGAVCIATAHHAGDQAETVLMHILRGAGPAGAAGMREREGDLWRPLLRVQKQELVAFLRGRGQPWREDATNAVADTPRNALRLDIFPRLEAIYPGASQALCRFAESQAVEGDFLEGEAARWSSCRVELPNGGFWPLAPLPAQAVLRRFFRRQLGDGATWERVRALASLCGETRGRETLPDGRVVEKNRTWSVYTVPLRAAAPRASFTRGRNARSRTGCHFCRALRARPRPRRPVLPGACPRVACRRRGPLPPGRRLAAPPGHARTQAAV